MASVAEIQWRNEITQAVADLSKAVAALQEEQYQRWSGKIRIETLTARVAKLERECKNLGSRISKARAVMRKHGIEPIDTYMDDEEPGQHVAQ